MARIEFVPEIIEDFERILEYLLRVKNQRAALRMKEITDSIEILEQNPLLGKPAPGGNVN